MSARTKIMVVSTFVAGLTLGCGADPVESPKTAANAAAANAVKPQPVAIVVAKPNAAPSKANLASPTFGIVHIEERILQACGDIPKMQFGFDSAEIDSEASLALMALARCFTTGPLAGRGMKLIGHTDERGETEYNFGLGQKRAGSVAEYLAKKGMESGRLSTSSHGELTATGTEDYGWSQDRYVEVLLAD
jgi:peptidoglycan-associated lipoprotein